MSRVSRLSWVRLFPEDFLGGVQQMDCRQVGQYMLLLCAQWCAERGAERTGVRDADAALRAILRGEDLDPDVRAKFEEVEVCGRTFLRNTRMSKEIGHSEKERDDRVRGLKAALSVTPSDTLSGAPGGPKPEPQPRTRTESQMPERTSQRVSLPVFEPHPFIPSREVRDEKEAELRKLLEEGSTAMDLDPVELLAQAGHYDGAKRTKMDYRTMSHDRLLNTIRDLRKIITAKRASTVTAARNPLAPS